MKLKSALLATVTSIPFLTFATTAAAQSITLDPPPVRQPLDENGVDLTSGRIVVPSSSIAIGGELGLAHSRYRVGNGWRHNWIMSIARETKVEDDVAIDLMRVQIGGSIREFLVGGSDFSPRFDEKGTLTEDASGFTYTDAQGVVYRFDKGPVANGESYYEAVEAVGSKVTRPDGYTVDLHYRGDSYSLGSATILVTRLQSVTNNAGYQLKFAYAANTPSASDQADSWYEVARVTAINNAEEYCDPVADACALDPKWPFLAYARSPGGTNVTHETVTDILGRQARFATDGAERLIGVKRPGESSDGMVIAYYPPNAADPADRNRIDFITHQGSYTRDYDWSENGSLLTSVSTDYLGRTRTVESDIDLGVIKSDTNAHGHTTSYEHDADGRTTAIILPEGDRTEITYDTRGRITETRRKPKSGYSGADIVTSATYPAITNTTYNTCANAVTCDKPLTTTDERGKVTNYSWDGTYGLIYQIQRPADGSGQRPTTTFYYSSGYARYLTAPGTFGTTTPIQRARWVKSCRTATICTNSANERVTELVYNQTTGPNLQPVTVTNRAGNGTLAASTSYTYDHLGNVVTVDGPLAGTDDTTHFRYDAAGQQVGTISADPDGTGARPRLATRTTYNADGQATRIDNGTLSSLPGATTLPANWGSAFTLSNYTLQSYDAFGRPAFTRLNGSDDVTVSVSQQSYDGAGRPECTATRMRPVANASLPASACTQDPGTTEPDRISQYVYGIADRLTNVWSGIGTPVAQKTAAFAYRPNGEIQWIDDAKNSRTHYTYDGFDRVVTITYPDPGAPITINPNDYEQVTYDPAGNILTHRTRRGETFSFTYDDLGRLTYKKVPDRTGLSTSHTGDVEYVYDLFGNLTIAKYKSGNLNSQGVTFGYDALGRQTQTLSTMGGVYQTTTFGYDIAGRRTQITHPDNKSWNYEYDALGRPTYLRDHDNLWLQHNAYHEDGTVLRHSKRNDAPDARFFYDAADRLDRIQTYHSVTPSQTVNHYFTYNAAGQVVTERIDNPLYTWNGHPASTIEATYQANGLNQYTQVDADAFAYDGNGNLTSDGASGYVYDPENRLVSVSGPNTATLTYDPLGRLWEVMDGQGNRRRMLYDGSDLIAEYNGANQLTMRYVHGVGAGDDPLVAYTGTGTALSDARFLYTDRLGSVVAQADSTGTSLETYAYDEFGVPDASGATPRFGFTGQFWLPEAGLYYYKARMYSPTLGRFMQTDPIGYGDGLNMYRYVGNDPVNGVDPTGMKECTGSRIKNRSNCDLFNTASMYGLGHGRGKKSDPAQEFDATFQGTVGDGGVGGPSTTGSANNGSTSQQASNGSIIVTPNFAGTLVSDFNGFSFQGPVLRNIPFENDGSLFVGEIVVSPGDKPVRLPLLYGTTEVSVETYTAYFVQPYLPRGPALPSPLGEIVVNGRRALVSTFRTTTTLVPTSIFQTSIIVRPVQNTQRFTRIRIWSRGIYGR